MLGFFRSNWAHFFVNSSKDTPPPPQNLHYGSLSSTSVILSWDPMYTNSGNNPRYYSIHLRKKSKNA